MTFPSVCIFNNPNCGGDIQLHFLSKLYTENCPSNFVSICIDMYEFMNLKWYLFPPTHPPLKKFPEQKYVR
jgi:hypothetical protein